MGSENLHEALDALSPKTRDVHRGIVSLMEELEAIDWYQQRAEGCTDPALREVLVHNKNEEIEHAVMTLEWIRRNEPEFDRQLRAILFREGPIAVEGDEGQAVGRTEAPPPSLGIGSLRAKS
ncbi:MAG: encapsulin-associated ferritin-like protein [Candidatus Binatia bacterium]